MFLPFFNHMLSVFLALMSFDRIDNFFRRHIMIEQHEYLLFTILFTVLTIT